MYTQEDLQQLKAKNISIDKANEQLENFENGFPFINLSSAATKDYGIISLEETEKTALIQQYNELIAAKDIVKFVPASGAASRMFKMLFEFMEAYTMDETGDLLFNAHKDANSIYYFFKNIHKFAFYQDLKDTLKQDGYDIDKEIENKNYNLVLDYLLNSKGLDYAALPKGLLKFHTYENETRFAVEEHLVEAAEYGKNKEGISKLHFTVSQEHQSKFEDVIKRIKSKYQDAFNVTFDISFSQQKPSTDTIAVDMDNKPFRENDGSILFRPGGHGALIENLNDIDADMVFIKNIDNVIPDHIKDITFEYKKVIGAYLINTQHLLHAYLQMIDEGNMEEEEFVEIYRFMEERLFIKVPEYIKSLDTLEQLDWLFEKLNKPIRVCGMVKNEGEPGGGPFVVADEQGEESLQIVESSQIDTQEKTQLAIVQEATHFNPVDLVCGIKDFKGHKFNLTEFVDPKTGFISEKSKNGKKLKAQELPGLWNGAMANWITIFMEVPILTFNPVKTVNDLLAAVRV